MLFQLILILIIKLEIFDMSEMPKAYESAEVEAKWYPYWEENGLFRGKPDPEKKAYSIVIPPPNVTGILTMGHVLNNTLQDILIRWRRMQGYSALWLPGTDHASIATEAKIVEAMKKRVITIQKGLVVSDSGQGGEAYEI